MPGGELEPLGPSGPSFPAVSADMTAIFVRAGVGEASSSPPRLAAVTALRPGRGGRRYTALVAAAAAGIVGLGAGAFVVRATLPAAPPRVVQTPPAVPKPSPSPVLAQASLPPVELSRPVVELPVQSQPKPVQLKPAQARAASPHEAVVQPASCERNVGGSGCRQAVIQADRHLRSVYQTAIRRGVSHTVLVDYRDRWADLRERDNEDPVHLIRGYGALADDLRRETRDGEGGEVRGRHRSGMKALADALLPWW